MGALPYASTSIDRTAITQASFPDNSAGHRYVHIIIDAEYPGRLTHILRNRSNYFGGLRYKEAN